MRSIARRIVPSRLTAPGKRPTVGTVTSLPSGLGGPGPERIAAAAQAAAPVYDFRRPTTLAREHARILELAFETFARQWGTQLTAKIRVMCQVGFVSVQMQAYDDYVAGLPALTTMVLCEPEGTEARAVIQFPASEALSWVCRMLGSPAPGTLPERAFTRIEATLIRSLMNEALEDLHYSLGTLLPRRLQVSSIAHQSQFAQAADKSQLLITAWFTVRVGERSASASVALPAELLLEQLGENREPEPGGNSEALLAASLGTVPVDVQLATAPSAVRPQAILDLAVGDILPLGHRVHQPFDLLAGNHRVGTAAAGSRSGRAAAVIVTTQES